MDENIAYKKYTELCTEELSILVKKSDIKDSILNIDGYKHSMVQVVSLAIALKLCIKVSNPPFVSDTYVFIDIIKSLGGNAYVEEDKLYIDARYINNSVIPEKLGKLIHGSMYLCPALLIAMGSFDYFGSGGCQIGGNEENNKRPIDHIVSAMVLMGANLKYTNSGIHGEIKNLSEISEIDIMNYSTEKDTLSGPLVGGATKTFLIMSLRKTYFVIRNAYLKTDVMDMIRFLILIGKKIKINNGNIYVEGKAVGNRSIEEPFMLTQCISEIITYATLSIACKKKITFSNLNRKSILQGLRPEFVLLKEMGVKIEWSGNDLTFYPPVWIKAVDICVEPQSIQSDHHPFFVLLLLQADADSAVIENVWKDRFSYAENLLAMGANVNVEGNRIQIKPSLLTPTVKPLYSFDVRTAAVTLLAMILTDTHSELKDAEHILRGYSKLKEHLSDMGVQIQYILQN